ncbi:SGNH/GDSL hydrolase family protein [Christiangramia aquimixticola]|uniref:SGNH/GDSL hydrolase family protein n=1 Tax=Christiangramia aquimixticola TaxID=1697558 RepID=UPI003AA7B043
MKKIKEYFITTIILLAGLLLIELTIRIINSDMENYDLEMWKYAIELKQRDPVIGHIHKSNKKAILQNVEIKLNSLGMRSEEPDPLRKKILFIGSSISLGWGVKKESTYVGIFENEIETNNLNYQVLNGSVGNYNTFRYVENFLHNQKSLNPDIIVINYFINDAEILPMGSNNWLLKNSALAASLNIAFKRITARSGNNLKEYYNSLYDPKAEGFKNMYNSLRKLSEYSLQHKIKIYFVIIPDIHFLENYPFSPIHQKMGKLATKLNFEVIDLYSALEGIPFDKLQITPGDSHPNSYGHKLMSKKLINEILPDLK